MAACKRKSEKMVSPAEDESNASLEHKEDPPGPFECSICLELMLEPVVACCGHDFCSHCLRSWLDQLSGRHSPKCPICRAKISRELPGTCKRTAAEIEQRYPKTYKLRKQAVATETEDRQQRRAEKAQRPHTPEVAGSTRESSMVYAGPNEMHSSARSQDLLNEYVIGSEEFPHESWPDARDTLSDPPAGYHQHIGSLSQSPGVDLDAGNETPRFQEALPRTGLANPVGELSRTADSIVEDLVRLSGLSSDTVGLVRRGWGLQQPHAPHLQQSRSGLAGEQPAAFRLPSSYPHSNPTWGDVLDSTSPHQLIGLHHNQVSETLHASVEERSSFLDTPSTARVDVRARHAASANLGVPAPALERSTLPEEPLPRNQDQAYQDDAVRLLRQAVSSAPRSETRRAQWLRETSDRHDTLGIRRFQAAVLELESSRSEQHSSDPSPEEATRARGGIARTPTQVAEAARKALEEHSALPAEAFYNAVVTPAQAANPVAPMRVSDSGTSRGDPPSHLQPHAGHVELPPPESLAFTMGVREEIAPRRRRNAIFLRRCLRRCPSR